MDRFQIIKGEEPPIDTTAIRVRLTPKEIESIIINGHDYHINRNNDAFPTSIGEMFRVNDGYKTRLR